MPSGFYHFIRIVLFIFASEAIIFLSYHLYDRVVHYDLGWGVNFQTSLRDIGYTKEAQIPPPAPSITGTSPVLTATSTPLPSAISPTVVVVEATQSATLWVTDTPLAPARVEPINGFPIATATPTSSGPDYLASGFTCLSFVISLLALALSFASFQRANRFQDIEYLPLVQIRDQGHDISNLELWRGVTEDELRKPDIPPAFLWTGLVENKGSKTVYVDTVYLECGSPDNVNLRTKYHLVGELYLSPTQHEEVKVEKSWLGLLEDRKKLGIEHIYYFIRVLGKGNVGQPFEVTKNLGGFSENNSPIISVNADALMPNITVVMRKDENQHQLGS